ncbi:MAG: hypothetical protein WCZ02_04660, partial [Lysobacterales bacterium]
FRNRHFLSGMLIVTIVGMTPLGAQTLNWPGAAETVPGPRASVVGTPVVTGTQTVAPTGQCSQVSISLSGTFIGTTDDGGGMDQITLEIWDDGDLMVTATASIPMDGEEHALTLTAVFQGMYATGAPGVGVLLMDGASLLFQEDPFIPTDIAGTCDGAGLPPYTPVPGPTGVVVLLLGAVLALFGVRRLRRQAG